MGKPTGFMEYPRVGMPQRPVPERIHDWREVYDPFPEDKLREQAARCMDCGIPFCHQGCPLGNIVPDWNDLVYKNRWREAIERLHATNNFPEFTGRLCPAPCEGSCVLGINSTPVTIKYIEVSVIDHAFAEGWVVPEPPKKLTGKKVAVIGSGPAGLACAQQLRRVGHEVTVFERADRIGGLLRYGIPDFKMEKRHLDRRLKQMETEGVVFKPRCNIGQDTSIAELQKNFDAIALCGGSTEARDLKVPGRELGGIHFAMEYLPQQNKVGAGDRLQDQILATGKNVVIIGGGDTGADCLGTATRQGAKKIVQLELLPRPPDERPTNNPWPQWPLIYRTSPAHEEGCTRDYSIATKHFSGENGQVRKLHAVRLEWAASPNGGPPNPREMLDSEFEIEADLVLLAMGFLGPEKKGMIEALGVKLDQRGNVAANEDKMTSIPGVFAAGDMRRGQSLIVWAIAEGRQCAKGIDQYLMGETELT